MGDKSVQGKHLRTFNFEKVGTDGAGTTWLTVMASSMVLDVWPVGDTLLEITTYEDESGVQRNLPVEAPNVCTGKIQKFTTKIRKQTKKIQVIWIARDCSIRLYY